MMPLNSDSSANGSISSTKCTTVTTKKRSVLPSNTTTGVSNLGPPPSYQHLPLPLLPIQTNTLRSGSELALSKRKRRRTVSSTTSPLSKSTEIINIATSSCDINAEVIVLHDDGSKETSSNNKTNNSINITPKMRKQNRRRSSYTKTLSNLDSEDFDFLMYDLNGDPKKPFKITRRKSTPKRQNKNSNIDTHSLNQNIKCLDFEEEKEEEPKKPFKVTRRKKATPNNNNNTLNHENVLQKCDLHNDKEESLKAPKAPRKRSVRKANNNTTDEKETWNCNSRKKTNISSNLCGLCLSCSCKKNNANNYPADDNYGTEGNKMYEDKMVVSLARSNAEVERALIARLARLEKSIAWFQHLHHKVFLDLKKLRSKYNNNYCTTKDMKKVKNQADMPIVLLVPDAQELEEIYEQEEKEKQKRTNDENTKCILELKAAKAQKIMFQKTTSKKTYQPSLTQIFRSCRKKSIDEIEYVEGTDENNTSLLHPYEADINEDNGTLLSANTIPIQERAVVEDGNHGKEVEVACYDDGSVSSSVTKTSNSCCLPRSESDEDDSSRFSFAAVSSSSIYWGAATTNNNMHTIASTLSRSLIQITSNHIDTIPNARGDTVYSKGGVIAVEKGNGMENLIELFETNRSKPNEEGYTDSPNPHIFRNIVNTIETGDATKLKAIQELCPQWKENVDYVLRKTDLVDVSHALTEVIKDLELTNKQLYVLEFFQFSLREVFNHLQQKYSCINRYSK